MIEVSEDELMNRLRRRWRDHGLDEIQIERRLEENDLPNGRTVRTETQEPRRGLQRRDWRWRP